MRARRVITKLYPRSVVDQKFDGIVDGLYDEGGELADLAEPTDETASFFEGRPNIPKEERRGNLPPVLVVAVVGALAAATAVGIQVMTAPAHETPPASPAVVTTVPSPDPDPVPTPSSEVWLPTNPATRPG